jgi:hypothetical protein
MRKSASLVKHRYALGGLTRRQSFFCKACAHVPCV